MLNEIAEPLLTFGSAAIIDGRAIGASMQEALKGDTARFKAENGIAPGLAVVLVGDDPASAIYGRNKGE